MTDRPTIATLGELRAGGYRPRERQGGDARQPGRRSCARGEPLLPGILGYDETVLPQIENAILAGQDIILLGERGQAKSRIARSLVALLDEWVPDVAGAELHDDPLRPVSRPCRATWSPSRATATPIDLAASRRPLRREAGHAGHHHRRPDRRGGPGQGRRGPLPLRRADDPLRPAAAHQPRHLPINELPDLAERIQVGLLNLMEERDVQIRGYKVRLELDLFVVASRQPGGLHQPRPDHHAAQGPLRRADPHPLPEDPENEIAIMEPERTAFDDATATSVRCRCPAFMREIVAELSQLARRSSRGQPALRRERAGHDRQPRDADGRGPEAGGAHWASQWPRRASATCRRWSPRRRARSSSRRWATRRARRRSSRSSCSARWSTSSTATSRSPSWSPLIERFEAGPQAEVGETTPSSAHEQLVSEIPELRRAVGRLDVGRVAGRRRPAASSSCSRACTSTGA